MRRHGEVAFQVSGLNSAMRSGVQTRPPAGAVCEGAGGTQTLAALLASSVSPWFQEAYILLQLASNPYSDTPPATEYQPNRNAKSHVNFLTPRAPEGEQREETPKTEGEAAG